MKITSTIRIFFSKSNANRIYQLGRMISNEEEFTLKTSSRSNNPDTLVLKREGEYTEEMINELFEECSEALRSLNDYEPIEVVSILVEKTTTEVSKYTF